MTNEEFARIVQEIGPLDDAIMAVAATADDQFTVLVGDDEIAVGIDFLGESDRFVIYTEIGTPAPEKAFAVYEFLMTIGSMWRTTDGLGISLLGPGGSLLATYSGHASSMGARALANIAVNMAARGAVLAAVVNAGAADVSAEAVVEALNPFEENMMRV